VAFLRLVALPSVVRGPVELRALRRLAGLYDMANAVYVIHAVVQIFRFVYRNLGSRDSLF
jgi:hypothetical protein